jgi:hypothetical protein
MYISTYIIGSFYIVRSIFRLSENITNYIFKSNLLNLQIEKFEKINETIFSTIHSVLVSTMASFSIRSSLFDHNHKKVEENDNSLQYLTASICFSYFIIDLFKCLYHRKYLFIIHHIASIFLLLTTFYSFYLRENKGFYAMYLIFLLESNTILLNIGFLLKELKFHYSITCSVWIIHLLCFFLFRIITLPKILITYYFYENVNSITIIQLPCFMLIFSGSIYWSYRQAIGIKKYLKENCVI